MPAVHSSEQPHRRVLGQEFAAGFGLTALAAALAVAALG